MTDTTAGEGVIVQYEADLLLDNIACATQNRALLRGDPAEDKVLTEAVLENGKQAISRAITKALAAQPSAGAQGEARFQCSTCHRAANPAHFCDQHEGGPWCDECWKVGDCTEIHGEGCHTLFLEEALATPAQPPAHPVDIVPSHCTGASLSFEPGVLHVSKDGSGYIAIDERHFSLEDDRCDGPDGPEGSVHWITRLDASEMVALRDFLNGSAAQPDTGDVAALRSMVDSMLEWADLYMKFGKSPGYDTPGEVRMRLAALISRKTGDA